MKEMSTQDSKTLPLPSTDSLGRLAISERGFVFDPLSGNHFTLNETGLAVIRQLQQGKSFQEIIDLLQQTYDINEREMERDLMEFSGMVSEFIGD
jgi:hypothetical protein